MFFVFCHKLLVYLGGFICLQFLVLKYFDPFFIVFYVFLYIYDSKLLIILGVIVFFLNNSNMEEWWVACTFPRFGDVSL
jgi:hypothetical protein